MGVKLGSLLEDMPGWEKMRDYANERLEELGWEISVLVRRATPEEVEAFFEEEGLIISQEKDDGTIELMIDPPEKLGFDEMQRIFEKYGIMTDDATLMTLWASQEDLSDPEAFAEANIIDPRYH